MGSGTTIGEAVKLGCRAIGRDINPVSHVMVSTALQTYSKTEVRAAFQNLSDTVGQRIKALYKTTLSDHEAVDVLYYFWVKTIPCPTCNQPIELFKTRVFARHATPSKQPHAKALCPACRAINDIRYDAVKTTCNQCGVTYNPQRGVVNQSNVTCPACESVFAVIDAVRKLSHPPQHRMYAKIVLREDGRKEYLPTNQADENLYHSAEEMLSELWPYIPQAPIKPGYNTNQALNYNYHYWHQMFNARQLVSLALLAREIASLPSPELRTLFACLLSGVLEFNNMFASFKGEGTGAVRHMFAHHILKPELAPLEANVWGTSKSSGAFSTLFRSRILRMLDYKARPFELRIAAVPGAIKGHKVYNLSQPVSKPIASDYESFLTRDSVYLSTGDSSSTDLPDKSVDLVITDPPFFDNVHYSQLADFFYVWLQQILGKQGTLSLASTRSTHEVQDTEANSFATKLTGVWTECHRVLKDDGLLIFTYHHSRIEGWSALYQSIRQAGFEIVHSHPVKSEMAVAVPIQQSKEPINFDLILVCRKSLLTRESATEFPISACVVDARRSVHILRDNGLRLSASDIRVILMGCILSRLASLGNSEREAAALHDLESRLDTFVKQIRDSNRTSAGRVDVPASPPAKRRTSKSKLQDAQQLRLLERNGTYQPKRRQSKSR